MVAAGIYLASDGHHWSEFFVQWGLAAVIVIGALVGAVLIPASKKAEEVAERDLAAAAGSRRGGLMSAEYQGAGRASPRGIARERLVLLTIVFMVIQP